MSSSNDRRNDDTSSSRTGPLGLSDPRGQYEFQVELNAVDHPDPRTTSHLLFASRHYTDIDAIAPVWPDLTDIATLLEQLIDLRLVDHRDGAVSGRGVTVTTVFRSAPDHSYTPVDVLFNGHSIDQYRVSPGFWRVPDRLCSLIDTHGGWTLTHREIPYSGRSERHQPFTDPAPGP